MSNSVLLVCMLFLLVVEPFLRPETFGSAIFVVITSAVLFAAVWAVSRRPALLVAGLLLAAPAFAARWALHFADRRWLVVVWLLFALAFLAFTAAVVLWRALRGTTVTADTIAGAICVYLLLGLIWALIFSLLEITQPGSFLVEGHPLSLSSLAGRAMFPELLYLSLVTISTVGYGDILPATAPARMIAALEAVVGQLYLAVLIARLVGLHVPRASKST